MRNDCVQNLKSISQMVIELWLIKNCLILGYNDLKFYFRYNTLNSKGHKIFLICPIALKFGQLNLLLMAKMKIILKYRKKAQCLFSAAMICHFRFSKFINVIVSGQNIFMSPTSYEVVTYVI